jgi:primosomal protein N' (replication factor Y)
MTLHQNPAHLRCHHCNSYKPIPSACPNCKNTKLKDMGVGTERLEIGLKKHFPDIPVVRIDRDTTRRKNSLNDMLTEIHKGKRQILIGTQMLAKGHHFPNVTLVCIVNIDGGFFSADFRAAERTAQLIIQVAGRAGRADKLGHVFIQTHYPEHPLLVQLIKEGYKSFAKLALQEREEIKLPPYMYLALLRAEAFKKELPDNFLNEVKDLIGDENKKVSLLGPIPAPIQRVKGRFCTQLLLQASKRADLHKVLGQIVPQIEKMKASRKVRWSLDVDPMVSI